MQTFLPYPSFAESAAVLDSPRLGKQRVETLQVLRSLLLPSYGWQNHPVSRMWRGFTPGLTAYGLATIDAWTARGHADSTRTLITEFAPDVVGLPQEELASRGLLPGWIGNQYLHESHRSNLIRKAPEYYGPLFPGTPVDLDYLWPDPITVPEVVPPGEPVWILRARTEEELDEWREEGIVAVGERSPLGRDTPKWRAQLASFIDGLQPGTEFAAIVGNGAELARGTVLGDLQTRRLESGESVFVRDAEYGGSLARSDFAVPAILQDPRSVFPAHLASAA